MTSWFDSAVGKRREHTPWARMSVGAFMTEMALNGAPRTKDDHAQAVVVQAIYRPDVASRIWWTVSWPSESGERLEVSAQTMELALWRAAEMELSRRKPRQEPPPATEGPEPPPRVIGPEA